MNINAMMWLQHSGFNKPVSATDCLAMPHIAHMMFAGILCVIFAGMTLVMSIGYTDLNPLSRNWLARSDPEASFKILALKMVIVVVVTGLDCFPRVQVRCLHTTACCFRDRSRRSLVPAVQGRCSDTGPELII